MKIRLPHAIALLAVAAAGCKPQAKPCPSTSASASALVKEAAVVRLDVYGSTAHCHGSTLAPGAPPPAQSKTVAGDNPLTVDVPAGHHVLLLSAFRDAAATQLLGSACTETDVKAGEPACFDLKLAAAPDGAVPNLASDMAGDMARLVACSAVPDNCPAGQYCASDGNCTPGCKADLDCAGTPTTPRCLVGAHECVACLTNVDCGPGKLCSSSNTCADGCDPQAPACPGSEMCCTNVCIDTTSDVGNCGGCGTPCKLANATPSCSGSHCSVKQCNGGFSDCDGKAANGCECPDLGDANHGCCPAGGGNPGGCEYQHSDGFNHTYIDCYPPSTYNIHTATDAAQASTPDGTLLPASNCSPGNQQVQCIQKPGECTCFTYADSAGGSYTGLARRITWTSDMGDRCLCPTGNPNDPSWK
jgi:hypothetical protein